ncbi:MAG: bifunctional diguanylate cyclase/phosphodiesterase [Paracoccaceae bacterium]|nr:bifunctional diguanylate cyclase/phosphodiesterase [Paracoccaceae bacterium]
MPYPPDLSDALSVGKRRRFLDDARSGLRSALQPIVDFETGKVFAYEGLARGSGRLPDAAVDIFAAATAHDCVFEVDLMLAERALEVYAGLRAGGWPLLFLNLHGGLLASWQRVRDALNTLTVRHAVRPTDICIELSEANQTLPMEAIAEAVRGLRASGYQVAVDDFGTGHSGLLMLYHTEPDFLKIDRFFIQAIPEDSKKRLLVGSIVDLAHTLGIRVIAEGIETVAEMMSCRDIRCDLAQGYHIARPTTDYAALRPAYPVPPRRRHRTAAVGRLDLRPYLDVIATLTVNARMREVLEVVRESGGQPVIPVLDEAGAPRGALREADIRPILFSPFGRELVQNESLKFSLTSYVRPILTVDIETEIAPMLDLITDAAADGVLVTEKMGYIGYLSSAALLQLANEMRLREASRQNPLSGLPGNEAISAALEALAGQRGKRRVACYIDIDNFKPFNDRYGFEVGDRAILLCAAELKSIRQDHDAFVGHIGGDDFFVCATGAGIDHLIWRLDALRDRFAAAAEALYSAEDRSAKSIPGKARDGTEARFPLLSCTVVTVALDAGETAAAAAISSRLAELKAEAKRDRSGVLHASLAAAIGLPERRRDGDDAATSA